MRLKRALRRVFTGISILASLGWLFYGYFARGLGLMGCSVEGPGNTHWHQDPDAWQWNGQLVMVLTGVAALIAGARLATRGRPWLGFGLFGMGAGLAVAWWLLVLRNLYVC